MRNRRQTSWSRRFNKTRKRIPRRQGIWSWWGRRRSSLRRQRSWSSSDLRRQRRQKMWSRRCTRTKRRRPKTQEVEWKEKRRAKVDEEEFLSGPQL